MNSPIHRIGYIGSLFFLLATILFALCFVGVFALNPIVQWSTLAEYANYCRTYPQILKHLAQASMILLSICLVLIISSVHQFQNQQQKFYSRLSLHFVNIATTLMCMGYFIQFTTVKKALLDNQLSGLEHFVQFYPNSAILAIIMLGYTLFLGLATSALLPLFGMQGTEKLVKVGLMCNSIACFLGFVGFVFQIIPLILIATNLGNGLAFMLLGIGFMRYFR